MSLPKIEHVVFTVEIPSTKEQKKFRPFTVKEEKLLLIATSNAKATDEADPIDAIETIKQIINNCAVDDIEVNTLSIFDIEWFIHSIKNKFQSATSSISFSKKKAKSTLGILILKKLR